MRFAIQIGLVITGIAAIGIAYAFLRGVPEVVALWPYATTYGLSKVFIASMFAAIGAPVIWIGLSGDFAAIRPGSINIIAASAGLGGQAVWKIATGTTGLPIMIFAGVCWGAALAAAVMLFLARSLPWRDPRPTPWLVRIAFGIFAFVLLVAGGLLVQRVQVFPWVLNADGAVAYGIMLLGAAAYFIYGLVDPVWSNARGQLVGFLAYDLVLIVPFVQLWPASEGIQRLSLTVYLAVLVVSGTIAIWFLFFNPIWKFGRGLREPLRDWRRRPAAEAGTGE